MTTHSQGCARRAAVMTASTSSLPSRPNRQNSAPTPCSINRVRPMSMPSATGLGSQGPGTRYGSSPITSTCSLRAGVSTAEDYVGGCAIITRPQPCPAGSTWPAGAHGDPLSWARPDVRLDRLTVALRDARPAADPTPDGEGADYGEFGGLAFCG